MLPAILPLTSGPLAKVKKCLLEAKWFEVNFPKKLSDFYFLKNPFYEYNYQTSF